MLPCHLLKNMSQPFEYDLWWVTLIISNFVAVGIGSVDVGLVAIDTEMIHHLLIYIFILILFMDFQTPTR